MIVITPIVFLLYIVILLSCIEATDTFDLDHFSETSWEIITKGAPKFAQTIQQYAPHLHKWLSSPGPSQFTLFAPVDPGCSLSDMAGSLNAVHLDAFVRYHIIPSRPLYIPDWREPELLETGLECNSAVAPFCFLPTGQKQILKIFRDDQGIDRVFDGELPEVTVLRTVKTKNGSVIFVDRTLVPPLVNPSAIRQTSLISSLLESAVQAGLVDYHTTPVTIFAPANRSSSGLNDNSKLNELFIQDPLLAASYIVPGVHYSRDFQGGQLLRTFTTHRIPLTDDGSDFFAQGVRILLYDVPTSFGVVHVIEGPMPVKMIDLKLIQNTPRTDMKQTQQIPTQSEQVFSVTSAIMVAGAIALTCGVCYFAYNQTKS